MKIIRWIKWLIQRKPMIEYPGYNCGLCGKWISEKFSIRAIDSCGRWWDTWGLCDKCANPHQTGETRISKKKKGKMYNEKAAKAVSMIIEDLEDRRGLRQESVLCFMGIWMKKTLMKRSDKWESQ